MPNIQDGDRKAEVQITFLYSQIPMSFQSQNGVTNQAAYMYPRTTVGNIVFYEYQDGGQEPEVVIT